MIKKLLFGIHPRICFAGPRGGGGPAKPNALGALVEANRFLNCGRIKEGVAILETAMLEKIGKGFSRDDFPLVLKLVSVYGTNGFGDISPVRKEALGAILLQASDTADKLVAIAKEDPNKLTAAEKFHVGAGFSAEAAPAKIEEFAITVSRLIEKLDSPIEVKPVVQKPAPVVVLPPKQPVPKQAPVQAKKPVPMPTITPVASTPPAPKPVTPPAAPEKPITPPIPKPAPQPAVPAQTEKPAEKKQEEVLLPSPFSPSPSPSPFSPSPSPSPSPTLVQPARPIIEPKAISLQPIDNKAKALETVKIAVGQIEYRHYKEAIPILKKALETDPNCSRAIFLLNVCAQGLLDAANRLLSAKNLKGAGTLLGQAQEANPTDPEVIKEMEKIKNILSPKPPAPIHTPTPQAFDSPAKPSPTLVSTTPQYTPPLSPGQKQARNLLAKAMIEKASNRNKALPLLLEALKLDPENPEIKTALDDLFVEYKEIAISRAGANDHRSAQFACSQALRLKPDDPEILSLAAEAAEKLNPLPPLRPRFDIPARQAPVPAAPPSKPITAAAALPVTAPASPLTSPSGPAPLTPQERLQRILDIMKRKYHEKGYAWIIKAYEEYPKTIGNNVPTLCYYLHAQLATKFPLLLDFDRQRFSSIKDNNIKTALRFLGRLERMILALEFLAANKDKNALETMSIDPQAYNLLYNTRKIMQISEARVAVGIIQDPETEARLARELKEEFDKVIGLEVVIESSAERRARLEKEQKETARLEKEKLRQRVLQYFIDHPNAKTPFEEWLWYALYREGHRVFNGAKEAKRLALEEISRRKKEVGQQEVIEFLRKHPGITSTEILASHSHILNLLYNKDLFPGGIKEARALAEEKDL